jgi:hypothetical protein
MDEKKLWDYLPELVVELTKQLRADDERWGDTYLKRTRKGQEQRIRADFDKYFDQFEQAGTPVPWLKIIGNAFIGWMRSAPGSPPPRNGAGGWMLP